MKSPPSHEAERWLKQARRDLDDAKFALSGRRYNLACFVAPQAAEKTIKAYLYFYYIPTRYPNGLPGGIPADAALVNENEKGSS